MWMLFTVLLGGMERATGRCSGSQSFQKASAARPATGGSDLRKQWNTGNGCSKN